jgi:uncharacterized protein YbaR (Trm112 family)
MIILTCPECYSENLKRDEERKSKKDWFICKDCGHKFPLEKASYTT